MATIPPLADDGRTRLSRTCKIIALGLNYRDHVEETGLEMPSEPVLFTKTPNVLIGHEEYIVIPAFLREYGFRDPEVHYEAELAVVMGRRACGVSRSDAMSHVEGYACFNDVSHRDLQFMDVSGWFRGKSLDTFGPIGPRLVPAADIPDPHDLEIACRLNGRTVQDSRTSEMLFSIPEIIAFISKQITLEPGDIIATGTPAGVGPLAHGDIVEVEIERIGTLRNRVVDLSR